MELVEIDGPKTWVLESNLTRALRRLITAGLQKLRLADHSHSCCPLAFRDQIQTSFDDSRNHLIKPGIRVLIQLPEPKGSRHVDCDK